MHYVWLILTALGSFLFLTIVFRPLELSFPAKSNQRFLRADWWLDLCFFLGQYLVWNGLVVGALFYFRQWLNLLVPVAFRSAVASQSWWLQMAEVIVLSDMLIYWGHRLQHRGVFTRSITVRSIWIGLPLIANTLWTRSTRLV